MVEYRTKRALRVVWSATGGPLKHTTELPRGYPVKGLASPMSPGGKHYVAGPSRQLGMSPCEIVWHDATYYGIPVAAEDVEEVSRDVAS